MRFDLKKRKQFFAVLAALAFAGCYNDKADQLYPEPGSGGGGGGNTCDTANISFATTIKPVLEQYCGLSGCHDAATPSAGYNLTGHAGLKLAHTNGRLLGAINHQSGFSQMPKGMAKLSECNLNKITAWVNQGTLDN
jgi:hypothetical protein